MPRPKSAAIALHAITIALYLRYSTGEQGDQQYSTIDAQREYLTRWATENGFRIVAEFVDEARTGTNLKRPGYRAMLEAAQKGEFANVAVTFMDRLGRGKTFDIAEYELGKANIRVVTACQVFTEDTGGYIGATARKMVDGIYPRLVRDWTEAKILSMLKAGYHCAGRAPFGYEAVPVAHAAEEGKNPPKRLIPNGNDAEIVREAYRIFSDTQSQAEVRRYLIGATDQTWSFDRIERLLTSRTYLGVATWGRHINEAAHLPIVDKDLWEEVQAAFNEPKRSYSDPDRQRDAAYYLRGRVYCDCGRKMTPYWSKGRNGTKYRYYQCMGHRDFSCPWRGQVAADTLHKVTFVDMADLARSGWKLRQLLTAARERMGDVSEARKTVFQMRREVKRCENERDRFVAALRVAPRSAMMTLTKQLGECEISLEHANARVQAAEREAESCALPSIDECQVLLSRVGEAWAGATEEERGEIATLTVDRITVCKDNVAVIGYYEADMRFLRGEVSVPALVKGG